jgi:predicted acyl esterase
MRRWSRASLVAIGALAAVLVTGSGTTPTTRAASPPSWTTYDRPAQYSVVVDQHVPVQMSDGVILNAEVRRPDAPGRFPVIVTITPYNGTNGAVSANNDYFVQRGYVQVVVDARGTGESQGTWDDFGSREQRDGYEVVEWAAAQSWSNGSVGMWGPSYMAITQLLTAAQRPPHLEAIFPIVPMGDSYRDMVFPGGQNNTGFIPFWLVLVSGSALIPPTTHSTGTRPTSPARSGSSGSTRSTYPVSTRTSSSRTWPGTTRTTAPAGS